MDSGKTYNRKICPILCCGSYMFKQTKPYPEQNVDLSYASGASAWSTLDAGSGQLEPDPDTNLLIPSELSAPRHYRQDQVS